MGKRTGVINHVEGLAKLTPVELEAEIARCKHRLRIAPTAYLRKSFTARIDWLERFRDRQQST